jgi:alpha-beta hydrolase superfamily lysophospholipase
MPDKQRWVLRMATSVGTMGIAATGGVLMLANRFVDELSRPHMAPGALLDISWKLPEVEDEPLPASQRALLFHTRDGKLLRGDFWAQPRPAPTIILCHGYRVSRDFLRPVAALEYQHGYNLLLFDFRGHGSSESVFTSGGNIEVRDLEAAIAAASQQPETIPGKIILHGFSMGASIALLTLPHPDVIAVIADSPYAHLDDILRNFVRWQLSKESRSWPQALHPLHAAFPAISWMTVAASTVVFRLRYRHRLMAHPARHLKGWQARAHTSPDVRLTPILLIHGTEDHAIPIAHAYKIAAIAEAHSIPLETYFSPGSKHCNVYGDDPQRYIDRLQEFAARYLGDDFPGILQQKP